MGEIEVDGDDIILLTRVTLGSSLVGVDPGICTIFGDCGLCGSIYTDDNIAIFQLKIDQKIKKNIYY